MRTCKDATTNILLVSVERLHENVSRTSSNLECLHTEARERRFDRLERASQAPKEAEQRRDARDAEDPTLGRPVDRSCGSQRMARDQMPTKRTRTWKTNVKQGMEDWCDEATAELLADNAEILANFKEAHRALDQARTAQGFYPVRPPGQSQYKGKASPSMKSITKRDSYTADADKTCFRCGKKGHTARRCPQKPTGGGGSSIGYVGWSEACENSDPSAQPDPMVTSSDQPEVHMETWNLRNTSLTTFAAAPASGVVLTTVLCPQSTELRGKAVDSGAKPPFLWELRHCTLQTALRSWTLRLTRRSKWIDRFTNGSSSETESHQLNWVCHM